MSLASAKILKQGDQNGNGRPFRLTLPSGLDVFGVPTPNFYTGEWDLGPTWNYLVMGDEPFLVDTGRHGTTDEFFDLLAVCGLKPADIRTVLLSHGHEDHDGGLPEIAAATGARILAHPTYERLIRYYPGRVPEGARADFPASCWSCNMPDKFAREFCLDYHRARSVLSIEGIENGGAGLPAGVTAHHLPGHTPDSMVYQLGDEAFLLGDVVLPHISPFPSREDNFLYTGIVLNPSFGGAEDLYGLRAYLKSLRRFKQLVQSAPEAAALPGHRLYYGGGWNELDVVARIDELIGHHFERCGAILEILKDDPKTALEIARIHFSDRLLKGPGKKMAENEIHSHCELLAAAGDVVSVDESRFAAAGTTRFEAFIRNILEA